MIYRIINNFLECLQYRHTVPYLFDMKMSVGFKSWINTVTSGTRYMENHIHTLGRHRTPALTGDRCLSCQRCKTYSWEPRGWRRAVWLQAALPVASLLLHLPSPGARGAPESPARSKTRQESISVGILFLYCMYFLNYWSATFAKITVFPGK